MNTHALQQLFDTAMAMLDSTLTTLADLRKINLNMNITSKEFMSDEERKKRRRLQALRWSILLGVSYTGYKIINNLFFEQGTTRKREIIRAALEQAKSIPVEPLDRTKYHDSTTRRRRIRPFDIENNFSRNNAHLPLNDIMNHNNNYRGSEYREYRDRNF